MNDFRDALQATFGPLDWFPIPDGNIHRFYVPGDTLGTKNGWYILYEGHIESGCFGTWTDAGTIHRWHNRKPVDFLEAGLIRQRIKDAKVKREVERQQLNQNAVVIAQRMWSEATKPDHPYLERKGVKPHGLRQLGNVLLVPLYFDGQLVNLQRIFPDGSKRFLKGGMIKGTYSPIGKIIEGKPLYVCEGWATGATIHEETGLPVACAMTSGNLYEVTYRLQRRHSRVIIAGDDDRLSDGNPGRMAATMAGTRLGCRVVFPPFSDDAPLKLSDFNDLRQWRAAQ